MRINTFFSLIFQLFIFTIFVSFSLADQVVPVNLFNIGDSIGEAEAVDNVIGSHRHEKVWSSGFETNDSIYSFNERFSDQCPNRFESNSTVMDHYFNQAKSASVMSDFALQAANVVLAAKHTSSGEAGMITVYLGNNDVCSTTLAGITPATDFENDFRAGLDVLAHSVATKNAFIHISAIPDIYWLWEAMRQNKWCLTAWPFVPCNNLLGNPINDCGAGDSHVQPDTIQTDDGPNCRRRKKIHAVIRDVYNPILKRVVSEYVQNNRLPRAYFADIFGIRFLAEHINTGDCFHPSAAGQQLLAQQQWRNSPWSSAPPTCSEPNPHPLSPWLHLLLSQ